MDVEKDSSLHEFPPVFEDECSMITSMDRSERPRFQESLDSGYEASPSRSSCQEMFIFGTDITTEGPLRDADSCDVDLDEQPLELETHESDPCGRNGHSCLCVCGENQNCCSSSSCRIQSICGNETDDSGSPSSVSHSLPIFISPHSSRNLQTRNVFLSSSFNTVIRRSSYPHASPTRAPLVSSSASCQSGPTFRFFQSENVIDRTHCDWTIGGDSLPLAGSQTISVATQTIFENPVERNDLNGAVAPSRSDPVFHLPDQDTNSAPVSTENQSAHRTLPDVVQSPLAQTRGRSLSVPLSFDERVREAGSILRRVSREFEQFSIQSSISQDRTETLVIQVRREEEQQTIRQRRFSTVDSSFPHQ
ncbi:uncharacterized protein LOC111085960 [Limulus polyphemus]|uniref:Uncharacterized protein LOC111085960 n=1 Tax=Limulus polyphemus TaxID=6850 RepID=A0ABM1SGA3_LIMPO|nr:uncharacterized protein LOC111085960 [Limulus polyphemus]